MKLRRSMIDRIKITPGKTRGDPQVQLVGGLAAILELAVSGQQKTAIQKDSGVGRVFMVVGVGSSLERSVDYSSLPISRRPPIVFSKRSRCEEFLLKSRSNLCLSKLFFFALSKYIFAFSILPSCCSRNA